MSGVLFVAVLQGQQPYWMNGAKIPIYGIGISPPLSVVIDSPEIRKLIVEEEKRQDDADRFFRENHTKDESSSAPTISPNTQIGYCQLTESLWRQWPKLQR